MATGTERVYSLPWNMVQLYRGMEKQCVIVLARHTWKTHLKGCMEPSSVLAGSSGMLDCHLLTVGMKCRELCHIRILWLYGEPRNEAFWPASRMRGHHNVESRTLSLNSGRNNSHAHHDI